MSNKEMGTVAPAVTDVAAADRSEAAAAPDGATTPAFVVTTSRQFPSWLADTGGSLALSTYQSGKVILVGTNRQSGKLSV
ncbi:MAG: hypothetical protein Q8M69_02155, partial [Reyranella sp.]|nr:hypothetical protein [Reyranella sp.]